MDKKILYGILKIEYVPLSNGGEIDVAVFETTKADLENAGFTSINDFLDYVDKQQRDVVVAYDKNDRKEITAYEFTRRDGYNCDLRIGSTIYHTL